MCIRDRSTEAAERSLFPGRTPKGNSLCSLWPLCLCGDSSFGEDGADDLARLAAHFRVVVVDALEQERNRGQADLLQLAARLGPDGELVVRQLGDLGLHE